MEPSASSSAGTAAAAKNRSARRRSWARHQPLESDQWSASAAAPRAAVYLPTIERNKAPAARAPSRNVPRASGAVPARRGGKAQNSAQIATSVKSAEAGSEKSSLAYGQASVSAP